MYSIVLMAAMTSTPVIPDRCGCRCGCSCSCSCSCRCGCRCSCRCSCYCGCYSSCGCGGVAYGTHRASVDTAPATVIVSLPAEARLTIDGQATTSTSTQRAFVSPPLEPGVDYVYTLSAEVQRDGQTIATSQRVVVRAGQESRVTLAIPAASVAASER